jgi:hypothetical protein
MQTILHPWWALLVVPHDHVEEVGLRQLKLCICQNHLCAIGGSCSGTMSTGASSFDDLLRHGSRRRCRECDGIPFVIIIVLSHSVESILFVHFHDHLVTGLDHSFHCGLLLL